MNGRTCARDDRASDRSRERRNDRTHDRPVDRPIERVSGPAHGRSDERPSHLIQVMDRVVELRRPFARAKFECVTVAPIHIMLAR